MGLMFGWLIVASSFERLNGLFCCGSYEAYCAELEPQYAVE